MFLRYRLQSGKLAELLLPQTWTVGFARNYDFRHRSLLILRFFELINFLYIWPSVLLDFGSNLGFEEILLKFQTTPGFEPPSMLDNGLGSPLSQLPILNFKLWKKTKSCNPSNSNKKSPVYIDIVKCWCKVSGICN